MSESQIRRRKNADNYYRGQPERLYGAGTPLIVSVLLLLVAGTAFWLDEKDPYLPYQLTEWRGLIIVGLIMVVVGSYQHLHRRTNDG